MLSSGRFFAPAVAQNDRRGALLRSVRHVLAWCSGRPGMEMASPMLTAPAPPELPGTVAEFRLQDRVSRRALTLGALAGLEALLASVTGGSAMRVQAADALDERTKIAH